MKKGIHAFGALIAVIFVFLAVVITLNFLDSDLDPQIPILKDKESRIVSTVGGEIRLGLFWDDPNWQQKAHDILSGKMGYDQAPQKTLKIETVSYCRKNDYHCSPEDLKQDGPEIQKLLQAAGPLLKRYELLLEADSYFNPFDRSSKGAFQGTLVGPWMNLVKTFHLSLYFKPPAQAMPQLMKEAKLLRQMAEGPDVLLGRLITLTLLDQNVLILKDFLKQQPTLQKSLKADSLAVYQNLSVQQISVQTFATETFRDLQLVDLIQQHPDGASLLEMHSDESWDRILGQVKLLFLRPNETRNTLYRAGAKFVENECWLAERAPNCEKLDAQLESQISPATLVNPIGRSLARIVIPKYFGYWQKMRQKIEKIQKTAREI